MMLASSQPDMYSLIHGQMAIYQRGNMSTVKGYASRKQAQVAALDADERSWYEEAIAAGACHDDAMEAAQTLGYSADAR
jgi:hypothetical protein